MVASDDEYRQNMLNKKINNNNIKHFFFLHFVSLRGTSDELFVFYC